MLPSRRRKTSLQAGFGVRRLGKTQQQFAFRPIEIRFAPALAGAVDFFDRLVEKINALSNWPSGCGEGRYPCTNVRSERRGAKLGKSRHSRPQELYPMTDIVRFGKHPTPINRRNGPIERKLVLGR